MTLNETLRNAAAEACYVGPGDCRACERTGLPILPLRRAIVPVGSVQGVTRNGLKDVPSADGLRTLRRGYLYVLLDRKDWQAYEVTPEGALRQFNPNEMPRSAPKPLTKCCVEQGHDVISSFLNIDTRKYKEAWLAFADDPWPASVLKAHKGGTAPESRFQKLNLEAARKDPAAAGMAMTPDALFVDKGVFEYTHTTEGDFQSVHGFYSRTGKIEQTRGFVRTAMQRHDLRNGLLAFILEDPVGRVQEINATRLKWVEARATWAAQPDRAYRKLTSDCLLQLRKATRQYAERLAKADTKAQVEERRRWNDNPYLSAKAGLPPLDEGAVLAQNTKTRTQNEIGDLEERYHEGRRKSFMDEYERQWQRFQAQIDQAASAYCHALAGADFKRVEQYDYDGNVAASGIGYARTMSLCVRGGVTEQPGPDGKLPPNGATVKLWQGWLDDPNSPPFQALALRHKPLLDNLQPGKNAQGEREWNDTQKLYDALNKLIGSQDFGEKLLFASVKDAAAQTLLAVNSAATQLKPLLAAGIENLTTRLSVSVLLLHERVHATQLKVTMTVADYYALQCKILREQQAKLARQAGRKTGQQVVSLLTTGVLSTQLNDAALAAKTIEVTLWVEGKAQEVRKQLVNEAELLTSSVVVGIGTLEPTAKQVLAGVKIGARGAADLTRRGFAGLRGASGSGVGLLLAIGGLYLMEDGLTQNYKKLEDTVGAKHPEVLTAFAGSSMGLVGGGIEAVGLALQMGMKGAQGATGTAVGERALTVGKNIAKVGAVIGAAASAFDAVQAGMATGRADRAGDHGAARRYFASSVLYAGATVASVLAVGNATLLGTFGLGPLGWAILLGLAAYTVSKWAEGKESTPIERWARRCYFGTHDETPEIWWNSPADCDIALAELNAVVLGMDLGVQFTDAVVVATTGTGLNPEEMVPATLGYRFVLPGFNAAQSGYDWSLTVHRHNDFRKPSAGETTARVGDYVSGEVLASGSYQAPAFDKPGIALPAGRKPRWGDYDKDTTRSNSTDVKDVGRVIRGAITLVGNFKRMSIEAATLRVTYWPDRNQPELCAEVTMQEAR